MHNIIMQLMKLNEFTGLCVRRCIRHPAGLVLATAINWR